LKWFFDMEEILALDAGIIRTRIVESSRSVDAMPKKSDTLNRESEAQSAVAQELRSEEIRNALRRLREIGEKLPAVDAVAIVREGRDLAEQGSS
jgi:uncharacterized coiled-coil DUF342 family protein